MPGYRVYCSETQYMTAYVEADTEEEAKELVRNGDVDFDYSDSDNFSINEVELDEPYIPYNLRPIIVHPTIINNQPKK